MSKDNYSNPDAGQGTFPNPDADLDPLRALVAELRAEGVRDPVRLLRAGVVKMGQRALAAKRADPYKTSRWLETVLGDGASHMRSGYEHLSDLDRRRILAFDELYRERTGQEWSP